jgi:hypothetical protein
LERAPVTQGLLRVKKEEELQEVPGSGGGTTILTTPATDSEGTRSGLLCREGNTAATSAAAPFLLGRRRSPPPEDWKPLDKCYFCLDGKLPHDDQAPLVSNLIGARSRTEHRFCPSSCIEIILELWSTKQINK